MPCRLFSSTHASDEAVCLQDLWVLYAKILRGDKGGDLYGPDHLVLFYLPGISDPFLVQILAGLERKSLGKFFAAMLRAAREKGERFVFLAIGDPPKESRHSDPLRTLITSFEDNGGWVGCDVEGRIELLRSIKEARRFFPPATLPQFRAIPEPCVVNPMLSANAGRALLETR